MAAPFSGRSGYPREASTVVTDASPVRRAIGATPSPCATFQNASVRPPATSGSTTCVSGSPRRQLNSTTHGVPVAIDHQAGVQHAGEGRVAGAASPRAPEAAPRAARASSSAGVATATGTVRPHAAGVGAGVALEQALVILGDRQQLDVPAVRDREDRDLLALEERLDDDGGARRRRRRARPASTRTAAAASAARETDDGALAGGEARRLHDQRLGMAVDVVEGGAELR